MLHYRLSSLNNNFKYEFCSYTAKRYRKFSMFPIPF